MNRSGVNKSVFIKYKLIYIYNNNIFYYVKHTLQIY